MRLLWVAFLWDYIVGHMGIFLDTYLEGLWWVLAAGLVDLWEISDLSLPYLRVYVRKGLKSNRAMGFELDVMTIIICIIISV